MIFAADKVARSNEVLGQKIITANQNLAKKLEDISKKEIESKDRVNITLAEYERMKSQNELLNSEVYRLRNILEKFEVPIYENIIPRSIQTFYCEDPIHQKRKVRIEFEIDENDVLDNYQYPKSHTLLNKSRRALMDENSRLNEMRRKNMEEF